MKKILIFTIMTIFLVGNASNLNAVQLEDKDLFDDCLDEAIIDLEITGSLKSAIDYYDNCVEEGLAEIENFEL